MGTNHIDRGDRVLVMVIASCALRAGLPRGLQALYPRGHPLANPGLAQYQIQLALYVIGNEFR